MIILLEGSSMNSFECLIWFFSSANVSQGWQQDWGVNGVEEPTLYIKGISPKTVFACIYPLPMDILVHFFPRSVLQRGSKRPILNLEMASMRGH